ncbi:copper amine oxidase N-terminal domain-containing protein [Acetivibrio mesophilus]|uniref:Copper amine oxidase N-terminal domain-containing protein n=1 Tax=Acetivibrio mesophilus TaxID=2487273 RepID=A0A4Q0I7E1_9FIRM|nr:copper amine oxidase N-terminal domain-containing protein [Acetivibrio mesophilus]ODM25739.1 copper amine oxidase [Clostridium sp. Bc-iso-3]RXE60323.1 copper amine oxidase N-terminal domain-containing protein [Acetivibrio mesophilus]HHV30448.1 copper amine oxidase N-terminal domain-containing protein [Clostridium sp.]
MLKTRLAKALGKGLIFATLFTVVSMGAVCGYADGANQSDSRKIVTSDFVDLKFTVNKKNYTSKTANKELKVAPFISNGRTLVPFRAIFEELGYSVDWDDATKTVTATYKGNVIKLTIGSNKAVVDGYEVPLDIAPTIVDSNTVVPLRFVAENSGSFVDWNPEDKTISISRVGKFDTGTVLFYDQKGKVPMVYIYDGQTVSSISLKGNEIKNAITYNGGLLITLFDKENDTNNLVTYRNGKFEVLINNFEIKEKVEFNGNLLLHGYDRRQKRDSVYRFDGRSIYLIADNFAMGQYVVLNDKLIINKYDDLRRYSLLVFDKSSWNPRLLQDKFIIKETMIEDNTLFISAVSSEGDTKPFACYNGTEFRILHEDLDIDLSRTVQFKDKDGTNNIVTVAAKSGKDYFLVLRNSTKNTTKYDIYDLFMPDSVFKDADVKATTVKVEDIVDYNDRMFIALNQTKSIITAKSFKTISVPSYTKKENLFTYSKDKPNDQPRCLVLSDVETIYKGVTFKGFLLEDDNLLVHLQNKDDKDYLLYIFDKDKTSMARDIVKIKNIKTVGQKTFIAVEDIDRITDKQRQALLIYDQNVSTYNMRIRNLVLGMETKVWDELGDSLAVNGNEADIKRSKVYLYSNEFKELLGNFQVEYWEKIDNFIFTSGLDTDSKVNSFHCINSRNSEQLKDYFDVDKVIKAKGDYYFVYGVEKAPKTPFSNKKILYIYNFRTKEFIDLVVDFQLTDMLYIN